MSKYKEDKESELIKYKSLILATLDYTMAIFRIKTTSFDSNENFNSIKVQTEENYKKGRLTLLKQCFRDLSEPYIENIDLKFNKYLIEKTHYGIDIFKDYNERINKIIKKGKITTDNQFYDVSILANELSQSEQKDDTKIEILNMLLVNYEKRKGKKNIA